MRSKWHVCGDARRQHASDGAQPGWRHFRPGLDVPRKKGAGRATDCIGSPKKSIRGFIPVVSPKGSVVPVTFCLTGVGIFFEIYFERSALPGFRSANAFLPPIAWSQHLLSLRGKLSCSATSPSDTGLIVEKYKNGSTRCNLPKNSFLELLFQLFQNTPVYSVGRHSDQNIPPSVFQ